MYGHDKTWQETISCALNALKAINISIVTYVAANHYYHLKYKISFSAQNQNQVTFM